MTQPDLFDSFGDWKFYLKSLVKEDRIMVMKTAKFIHDYSKTLNFIEDVRDSPKNAMRYDRLRQQSDIRNLPDKQLPLYMRIQKKTVLEDVDEIRAHNKFLIEATEPKNEPEL